MALLSPSCRVDGLDEVQDAVTAAFADAALTPPAYLVATPGDAARVDRVS